MELSEGGGRGEDQLFGFRHDLDFGRFVGVEAWSCQWKVRVPMKYSQAD